VKRALLIADGSSDLPLSSHIARLAAGLGRPIEVVPVSGDRLKCRSVQDRVRKVLREDPHFELLFVHRDAETRDPAPRHIEVVSGATQGGFQGPVVPVVPVRMTESWLLLDEGKIRFVAGNPRGTMDLGLPPPSQVERVANAKDQLRAALATASGLSGRRLKTFNKRFNQNRRLLLERLDADGPVSALASWQRLASDLSTALDQL
jgi:hypothetical protein